MEMLILLYFAYAVYRAGLDAAVRGYALARGKDVYIGDGDRKRHYAGWTLGAALAVFGRSLWEGWRVAWPWARDQADAARARRAARRRAGDDWDNQPDTIDDPADTVDPASEDTPAVDPNDPAGDGSFLCAWCGRDISDPATSSRWIQGEGHVCGEHFPGWCAACGHPARDGDPLTPDDDRPPASDDTRDGSEPAEVIDEGTGKPVDAVWEDTPATAPLPAASWTAVRTPTP